MGTSVGGSTTLYVCSRAGVRWGHRRLAYRQEARDLVTPPRDSDDRRLFTSYSRKLGDYHYDIAIYEAAPPANAGRFYARVVNMVRLESGRTMAVSPEFHDEYGPTADEARSRLEAAVEAWEKNQRRSN